jgi:glycosyltransferase involved in cell wall biosynthesis
MILWGKLTGRKVILFAESWYPGGRYNDWLKGLFLDWFCDGFLVSGDNARRHFADRLGIPEGRIQTGYSVVDNAHFARAMKLRPSPPPRVILAVARFTPEKNLGMLVKAFRQSELAAEGWKLRLVGGGPLKAELEKQVKGEPAIELKDWVKYDDLPALYADASVFCLPSSFEPWGLVVNEAMAAGLTLILSSDVGALPEARRHTSVYIFSTKNEAGLVISMKEACHTGAVANPRSMDDLSPESWAEKLAVLTR